MQTIKTIISFILTVLGLMKKQIDTVAPVSRETPEPIAPKPIPLTNAEKLFKVAVSYLGKDASPKDLASDELGCAETVSNIIHEVFPDFPAGVLATDVLHTYLKNSSHFTNVLEPSEGCVIISPRTATQYGHVAICLSDGAIASNNSKTGKFEINYNFETWAKTFGIKGRGLKIYIYKPI